MQMIFKFLSVLACTLAIGANAQVVTLSKDARGTGDSRGEAVLVALENAVGKAFGFRLEGELSRFTSEHSSYSNDSGSEELVSSVSREIRKRTNTPDNTPVVGYEVLNAFETGIGWEAQVRLLYKSYQKLGAADNRRTVAVYAENKSASSLAGALESSLVASRRFNLLKRDSETAFNREKAFVQGADAAFGEAARLGQGEGADYLVLVQTSGYYNRELPVRVIKATGERLYASEAGLNYSIEVVEFASREIKWRKRGVIAVESNRQPSDVGSKLAAQLNKLSLSAATDLTEAIYPARIARVMGSQAVLNRGDGAVALGQRVNIYSVGEALVDPQSGESLGALEVQIASGLIVDVKPKFSVLLVEDGSLSEGEDYIVRWDEAKDRKSVQRKSSVKRELEQNTTDSVRKLDDAFLN